MTVSVGPALVTAYGLVGSNGAGPISAPGVKIGDRVVVGYLTTGSQVSAQFPGSFFEPVVSVADEIQQHDPSNLSSNALDVILVRLP